MLIHGVEIKGANVDSQTRCAHYHTPVDIIAIKFKCCGEWFPCFECHQENTNHAAKVWATGEFDTNAVLCGNCGSQMTIAEYLKCDSACPNCGAAFNPGCAKHYHLYFENPAEK